VAVEQVACRESRLMFYYAFELIDKRINSGLMNEPVEKRENYVDCKP